MPAGPAVPLYVYAGGFLTQRRLRRILSLAGYDLRLGLPGAQDLVGLWGDSPTAWRGKAVARARGAGIVRIEDAFLRSVRPGRAGDPPLGLVIDRQGVHFDARTPSDLEMLLSTHPLDDPALLARAEAGMAFLQAEHLSKYAACDPAAALPEAGYVLVIDQTRNDAALRACGATQATFAAMLAQAQADHPGCPILIKTHPETVAGTKAGHFDARHTGATVRLWSAPVSPWALMAGARAVYTVTSQMGFEAMIAGHRPHVFGQPFYAGWGLSEDHMPPPRRGRRLTVAQLFAAAMLLYPTWYDPYHDRLCRFEDTALALAALTRAWREDHRGWVAGDMRLWKRAPLQKTFGRDKPLIFAKGPRAAAIARQTGRRLMRWANTGASDAVLVEDGFLRSRGLGADLVAPLSLVLDDLGIYYDPTRPSRLEAHLTAAATLSAPSRERALRLLAQITAQGLSKYNIGARRLPALPQGRRILVPGQVEDDASIRLGGGALRSNRALLAAARAAHPQAVLVYKPHPDVRAGLRPGGPPDTADLADVVLEDCDPITAIQACDAVWTITSLLGFEALLHGKPVTCLGQPFYAGWGLTEDLGPPLPRRQVRLDLAALVHAVLIAYPRYTDPVSGLPCPVEIVAERLAKAEIPPASAANRALAKLQGAFASQARWWR